MTTIMRKYLILFLLFLLPLMTSFTEVQADADESPRIYLSGTEYDYPPFSVTDDGKADGFSVDLLKAVANEMGIEVVFKVEQWSILKEELRNGELDVLPLVGYTEERDEIYDFTVPYIVMRGNIFVRDGEQSIQSQNDLFDKEILVLDGDNSQEWAWSIGLDEELTATATYLEAFELLASGQYDAVLAQGLVGEKLLKDNEINNVEPVYVYDNSGVARQKLNLEGYEQKFCFAVVEGDAELLSLLNEGLSIVSVNGTYDSLYHEWFPFLIEESGPSTEEVIRIVTYILVPSLIVMITFYFITTRRTIRIKTKEILDQRKLSDKYLKDLDLTSKIFETSIRNAPIPIMIHAEDGEVLNISITWTKLTKYELKDIPDIYTWTEKAYGLKKEEVRHFISKLYVVTDTQHDGEFEVTTKDGRSLIWDFNSRGIGDLPDGRAVAMSVATDVTERIKREKKIEFLSYHDALTGLYNRRYFEDKLYELDTSENYPLALVMADINGLKLINDAFGHKDGDRLLVSASEVMKKNCRHRDLIARIGGDEFVILMPNTSANEAEGIIENILKEAHEIEIQSIHISIAFGVKVKTSSKDDIQDLFRSAEDHMYRQKLIEVPSMRNGAIATILNTLHEKDKNSEVHSKTVSIISEKLAIACGLSREEINEVKTAGLLHDIGKIIIPTTILVKDGLLTKEEYDLIKSHPEIGFRILNSTHEMRSVAEIVLNHHERWDGQGYPRGIEKDKIPLQARIISLADAFDAMTSERSYRATFTFQDALDEVKRCSGTQFDPEVVDIFVENFERITNIIDE